MYAVIVKNEKELMEFAKMKGLKVVAIGENKNSTIISKPKIDIDEFLYSIGIQPQISGFMYLKYIFENNFDLSEGITKVIYPSVATKFKTTSSRVERAIRHAIEKAMNSYENRELYKNICGQFDDKPSNSQFIKGCQLYLSKKTVK